jgi:hypothetical protein
MPPAGFLPTVPASERPLTHALDRAATGMGEISRYGGCKLLTVFIIQGNVLIKILGKFRVKLLAAVYVPTRYNVCLCYLFLHVSAFIIHLQTRQLYKNEKYLSCNVAHSHEIQNPPEYGLKVEACCIE